MDRSVDMNQTRPASVENKTHTVAQNVIQQYDRRVPVARYLTFVKSIPSNLRDATIPYGGYAQTKLCDDDILVATKEQRSAWRP